MTEDLLRPTISRQASTQQPWRVQSQGYVAFFGGTVAVTVIAYLNTIRLDMPSRSRLVIGLVGVVALETELVVLAMVAGSVEGRDVRLIIRGAAVLGFLVMAGLQRRSDRLFQVRGGDYASLWGPGLAAVFCCGIAEAVVAWSVAGAL